MRTRSGSLRYLWIAITETFLRSVNGERTFFKVYDLFTLKKKHPKKQQIHWFRKHLSSLPNIYISVFNFRMIQHLKNTYLIKISPFISCSVFFLVVKGSNPSPFKTCSGDLMTCYRLTNQEISCKYFGAVGKRMSPYFFNRLR